MDRLVASNRIFGQHLPDRVLEEHRRTFYMLDQGGWQVIENGVGRLHSSVFLERMNPCEHLVEHHAEGEDI